MIKVQEVLQLFEQVPSLFFSFVGWWRQRGCSHLQNEIIYPILRLSVFIYNGGK